MTGTGPRRRPAPVLPAVPRLAAKAQAQRAQRRRAAVRTLGAAAAGAAGVGLVAWVVLGSSWLDVERVEVVGNDRVPSAEVVAAADIPEHAPLARLDLDAVEAAVGRLPQVQQVTAHRSWPGTVRLEVAERLPVAAVPTEGGVTLVDRGGVPFAAAPEPPAGVVRLQVQAPGPRDGATRAALSVWSELPPTLREQVQVLRADSPSSVVLLLAGDRRVVWGAPGDTASKVAATSALLSLPGAVVDVSAPGVAVRR